MGIIMVYLEVQGMEIRTFSYSDHGKSRGRPREYGLMALYLILTLAVGMVSGFLIRDAQSTYMALNQPPLSPPPIVFPIVWTVLYVLMALAAFRTHRAFKQAGQQSWVRYLIFLYTLQLAMNAIWPQIFFRSDRYLFAFVWLLILLAIIIVLQVLYYRVDKTACWLMLPYVLWTVFAGYLTMGVYLLNR